MTLKYLYFYCFLYTLIQVKLYAGEALTASIDDEELVLLDSIAALRVGSSGLSPTYYSDAWFLSPFGLVKSLEEVIIQNIWITYGNEHGIKMTSDGAANEYSEQYFDMLQEQKGISRKKIEEMTKEFGYSIEDVKKELNNQYLVQQTVETFFAASGKLNISNDEVLEFYNNYPRYEEAAFIIESGVLAINNSFKIDINNKEIFQDIVWSNEPYQVYQKDLNDNFSHIDDCSVGDIIYYEYLNNKKEFLCYRLLEKKESRRLNFNELYEEITHQIQSMKYEDGYRKMTEEFLLSSKIIYEDNKVQNRCINYLKK